MKSNQFCNLVFDLSNVTPCFEIFQEMCLSDTFDCLWESVESSKMTPFVIWMSVRRESLLVFFLPLKRVSTQWYLSQKISNESWKSVIQNGSLFKEKYFLLLPWKWLWKKLHDIFMNKLIGLYAALWEKRLLFCSVAFSTIKFQNMPINLG